MKWNEMRWNQMWQETQSKSEMEMETKKRRPSLNYLSTIGYRIVILNIERPLADSNNNNTSNNNGNNYNNDKSETKVGGGTAAAVT